MSMRRFACDSTISISFRHLSLPFILILLPLLLPLLTPVHAQSSYVVYVGVAVTPGSSVSSPPVYSVPFLPSSLVITQNDRITYRVQQGTSVTYIPGNARPNAIDSSGRLHAGFSFVNTSTCDGSTLISSGLIPPSMNPSFTINYTLTYPSTGTFLMYNIMHPEFPFNVTVLSPDAAALSTQIVSESTQLTNVAAAITNLTARITAWTSSTVMPFLSSSSGSLPVLSTLSDSRRVFALDAGIASKSSSDAWYVARFKTRNVTIEEGDRITFRASSVETSLLVMNGYEAVSVSSTPALSTSGLPSLFQQTSATQWIIPSDLFRPAFATAGTASPTGPYHLGKSLISSGLLSPAGTVGATTSFSVTFLVPGVYPIMDMLHPENIAWIRVMPKASNPLATATPREYRSHSGYLNHLTIPTMGMSDTAYGRDTSARYHNNDGWSLRRSIIPNATLPDGRLVSNVIFGRPHRLAKRSTSDMHTQFAMFLSIDLTSTNALAATSADVPVPKGDPWFDPTKTGIATLKFRRWGTLPGTGKNGVPGAYVNTHTAWLDLNGLYGAWDQVAPPAGSSITITSQTVREFKGGRICEQCVFKSTVPFVVDPGMWRPGDTNLNKLPTMYTFATILIREHNRLCGEMLRTNPTWDDERLYQEARRLVIGMYQKIATREYIATLTGRPLPPYRGYNKSVDAAITMEFDAAAFRYGHAEFPELIWRRDEMGQQVIEGDLPVTGCLYRALAAMGGVGTDSIIRGMIAQQQGAVNSGMADSVRNFPIFGHISPTKQAANDMATMNIHRGRDVGLPTYNEIRRFLGLPIATSWSNITSDPLWQADLATLYAHIDDLDLWVGGVVEDIPDGAQLGPTLGALVRIQFAKLRDADRFWYENPDYFTPEEIAMIYNTTLATLIARNSNVTTLPPNVFFQPQSSLELYGAGTLTSFIPASYTHEHILQASAYHLAWTIDGDYISFELQVKNKGWVGIGFEPYPNTMKGADIILCSIWPNGNWIIQDSIALDVGIPTADTVVGGVDNLFDKSAQRVGELQIFRFKRLLNTGDSQDKVIHPGAMHIIYAFHPTSSEFIYHGPLRSPATYIDFFATKTAPVQISYQSDQYGLRIAIAVVAALLMLFPVTLFLLLLWYRDHARIRSATLVFCLFITIGALIGYAAVIISVLPRSQTTCNAFFWLAGIAWVLVYGSILTKTWRINRIFVKGGNKLTTVHISTPKLTMYLSAFLCAEVILMTVWSTADPLQLRYRSSIASGTTLVESCQSTSDGYLVTWIVYKLIMLLIGAYLSFSVRGIDSDLFNESPALSQSIYVSAVLAGVTIVFGFSLRSFASTVIIIQAVALIGSLTYTLAALFIPKFMAILSGTESGSTAQRTIIHGSVYAPRKSDVSHISDSPQQHKRAIHTGTGKVQPMPIQIQSHRNSLETAEHKPINHAKRSSQGEIS